MVDLLILSLAFTAGAVAFFSVCGFVMLPAYLTYFFGKETKGKTVKTGIAAGAAAGILTTLGFLTVFGVIGALITYFGRGLVAYIPWLNVLLGAVLILIGAGMLAGKTIALPVSSKHLSLKNNLSFYNFGIVYGFGSFGCTLPVFLSILSIALSADIATGFLSFILYALGMGVVMLAITIAAAASKGLLAKKIAAFAPTMKKVSALLVIIVGIYLIYFQVKTGLIPLG